MKLVKKKMSRVLLFFNLFLKFALNKLKKEK